MCLVKGHPLPFGVYRKTTNPRQPAPTRANPRQSEGVTFQAVMKELKIDGEIITLDSYLRRRNTEAEISGSLKWKEYILLPLQWHLLGLN